MAIGQVCLRRGEEQGLLGGTQWVFDNEIAWVDDACVDGAVVEVLSSKLQFVAKGFFNSKSKIVVRLLTKDRTQEIDAEFFRARIAAAWENRRRLGFDNACRVVFGEADGLPGLTVDKFGDCLSVQMVSLGLDNCRDWVLAALVSVFSPTCIYERDDLNVREKEGLPRRTGCLYGAVPQELIITEHEAKMRVDLENGQKTGHFLDQQENRGHLQPYCDNRSVLDLCCHTGGFAVHAALYGARQVEAVDVSQPVLEQVRENAARNGVAACVKTICANVFEYLREASEAKRSYDVIICDPPAFAKGKDALAAAYRGYKELNLRCMQLLTPNGILLTFSCSQFMTQPLFEQMLREAAADTGKTVRILERLLQSRDHPATLNEEHSLYLKGCVLQVL